MATMAFRPAHRLLMLAAAAPRYAELQGNSRENVARGISLHGHFAVSEPRRRLACSDSSFFDTQSHPASLMNCGLHRIAAKHRDKKGMSTKHNDDFPGRQWTGMCRKRDPKAGFWHGKTLPLHHCTCRVRSATFVQCPGRCHWPLHNPAF